jgi:protein tyrosine phosphatase type 4A
MYSVIQDKYLILDCPSEETLPEYLDILKQQSVTHLVRICDAANTYDAHKLELEGITVHDEIKFQDGGVPDQPAVDKWLQLTSESRGMIGVHCVSGIGRAPVSHTFWFWFDVRLFCLIKKRNYGL